MQKQKEIVLSLRKLLVGIYGLLEVLESPVALNRLGHIPVVSVDKHVALEGDGVIYARQHVLVVLEWSQLVFGGEGRVREDVWEVVAQILHASVSVGFAGDQVDPGL